MLTRTLLVLTTLLLSVYAFSVTQPNANQGWFSRGTNTLVWERVVTDPSNVTVVLTNLVRFNACFPRIRRSSPYNLSDLQDRSVLPINNQILVDSVDASSQSSLSIDAPSGGYPVGGTYRVNLVKSPSEVNTIFAQSDEFDISEEVASSSSATETSTGATS